MSVFYKDIVIDDDSTVREVDGLEGWSSNKSSGATPMRWSRLRSAGSFGKVVTFSNITVDGTSYDSIKSLRLFAFFSGGQTYSKWIVNNPLLPGETLELSFYASRGSTLNSTSQGVAAGVTRVAQISFSTSPEKFDDHLNFPGPELQRSAVTYEYGEGNLPASNGSNVGVVTSWQSKSGRSANAWVDCPNTPADEPATLDVTDVPNETGSEYTKVYRIVIRNDSELPAYLAMTSWCTEHGTHFYTTYHDIQLKVTSKALRAGLGHVEDNSHHLFQAPPHFNSSEKRNLNMNMHNFVNVGSPSAWLSAEATSYANDTPGILQYRAQFMNKKFYDHWDVYKTPVYLPVNGSGHDSQNDVFLPISNLDHAINGGIFGANNPGSSGYGGVANGTHVYKTEFDGRLYSITLRTENSPPKQIRVRLYKFNDHPAVTSGTKTLLGTINLNKPEGYADSKEKAITGYLKVTGSEDGIFTSGDLLMIAIDCPDVTGHELGNIIGTITLLRDD